jgi:phage-related protein
MARQLAEESASLSRRGKEDCRRRTATDPLRRHAQGRKLFKGIGSGVFEIALWYDSEAYRTVLAVQLGRNIYVLHAFQKKSKKGIAMLNTHLYLITQRYTEAKKLAEHEQDEE